MKKILHIIGTRPQYIKSSILIKKLSKSKFFKNVVIDTCQHFDKNMSDIFLKEFKFSSFIIKLNIKKNLSRITRLAQMIKLLGECQKKINPDIAIIYGDTDSTLAAAISLKKNDIKTVHIEAGLRSYDNNMPEEQNRIVADNFSDYLIAPTKTAVRNLLKEIFNKKKIFMFGDTMYDLAINTSKELEIKTSNEYILMTLHRDKNTEKKNLNKIIESLSKIKTKIIWPIHPKIKNSKDFKKIKLPKNLDIIDPLSYKDNLSLVINSKFVITDSGGLQKEAFFLGKYSFILRDETEWIEIVKDKKSFLIGSKIDLIKNFKISKKRFKPKKSFFGSGNTTDKIIKLLKNI